MRVWRMRTVITLKPGDHRRLKALARDRNTPHKHVWRAEIVLLSADGVGTNEIILAMASHSNEGDLCVFAGPICLCLPPIIRPIPCWSHTTY
jgi:hypothetical protein